MDTQTESPRSGPDVQTTATSRRRFIGTLATIVAGLYAGGRSRPLRANTASNHLHLQDCRIAGSYHYDCHDILSQLRAGDRLQLRRQPANAYDARAVEVFWRRHKLGYLPRLDNAVAASLLDRGHLLSVRIHAVDDPEEEWEPVQLRIWARITRRNGNGF